MCRDATCARPDQQLLRRDLGAGEAERRGADAAQHLLTGALLTGSERPVLAQRDRGEGEDGQGERQVSGDGAGSDLVVPGDHGAARSATSGVVIPLRHPRADGHARSYDRRATGAGHRCVSPAAA
ncbi:hypothetical protein DXX98_07680 [Janibacter melonis]|nr:hypothetical protein [Janibacter melonis]